jgi:hypothetical protein
MDERWAKVISTLGRCRSDDQCTGYLRLGDRRCVEGIMCDVYMDLTGKGRWIDDGTHGGGDESVYRFEDGEGLSETVTLPDGVRAYFGVLPPVPTPEKEDNLVRHGNTCLIYLNDGERVSLAEIGGHIQRTRLLGKRVYS